VHDGKRNTYPAVLERCPLERTTNTIPGGNNTRNKEEEKETEKDYMKFI